MALLEAPQLQPVNHSVAFLDKHLPNIVKEVLLSEEFPACLTESAEEDDGDVIAKAALEMLLCAGSEVGLSLICRSPV